MTLYVIAALLCSLSGSFQALLAWRFVHGLAAACVTVTRSVVRDLYSGRQMARVLSLTFVVFLTVPILAPSLGQLILLVAPWRYIFVVFAVFAAMVAVWGFVRLPETLHPEYRMTLTRTACAECGQARAWHSCIDFLHARHDGDVRNDHGVCRHGGADFLRGVSPAQADAEHVRAVRHFHGHWRRT